MARSRPARQVTERTHYLPVPRLEWPKVAHGQKTELRVAGAVSLFVCPSPVIGYSTGEHDVRVGLLVCEEVRSERLGAISPASLEAEGFESVDEFRRYWKARHDRGVYNPLSTVMVYRLRPWDPSEDPERFGRLLLDRLYLDPLEDAELAVRNLGLVA